MRCVDLVTNDSFAVHSRAGFIRGRNTCKHSLRLPQPWPSADTSVWGTADTLFSLPYLLYCTYDRCGCTKSRAGKSPKMAVQLPLDSSPPLTLSLPITHHADESITMHTSRIVYTTYVRLLAPFSHALRTTGGERAGENHISHRPVDNVLRIVSSLLLLH